MRFNNFRGHAIFQNPFSVEVSDASEKLNLQLIELQYDSILHCSFNQEALITFMLLYQYLGFLRNVNWHEIWKVYLVAYIHVNRPFHV
jgi:hypothetical protein